MDVTLHLDFETRGVVDLLKRGAYVYAMDKHTDVLMASYRFGDGPIRRWRRGEPCPADIRAHIEAGGTVTAHNAAFERLMWWHVLAARHGWPKPRIDQFRCTATTAAAMSLPRSLDRLGAALDLAVKKDKRGTALIKAHSIPAGADDIGEPIWNDNAVGMADFHDYCDIDVATETEADKRLVPLSDYEQAVYVLSETINDRGIRIDVESARAAVELAEKAKVRINQELVEATGGALTSVTEGARMIRWLNDRFVMLESLSKEGVEELLLCDDLDPAAGRVLELRLEGTKPSVEKIAAMLARCSDDGRARGVYLCHGAGQTGRFSSRGLQAHNMPKYRKVFETANPDLATLFDAIRTGDPDALTFLYGEELGRPLHLLSDAVRSFIWAAPGHEFINADFTSIEGVVSAWVSDEEWKVQAFRDLIAGTGPGMYELLASSIYNVPVAGVTKPQRSVGKVGELSMGYQGGVGALSRMAAANKLKLADVFPTLWETADLEIREAVDQRYEERLEKHDERAQTLGPKGWKAAELIKVGWRAKHPAITHAWREVEEAATGAVVNPGHVYTALSGRVAYVVKAGFLWCRLPSGRCLAYGSPKTEELEAPWADKTLPKKDRETKRGLTVLGVDAQTEKWIRFPIYGGSLFNNIVQGSARDILVHGMFNAEKAGYPIVLHTHDECMAELRIGKGSVAEFERIICDLPDWAKGIPLKASGWKGKRYRKD